MSARTRSELTHQLVAYVRRMIESGVHPDRIDKFVNDLLTDLSSSKHDTICGTCLSGPACDSVSEQLQPMVDRLAVKVIGTMLDQLDGKALYAYIRTVPAVAQAFVDELTQYEIATDDRFMDIATCALVRATLAVIYHESPYPHTYGLVMLDKASDH